MRASQISEEDCSRSKMRSTGASIFHRAVGRETTANWGNRIVKDFYDLDYDLSSSLTKFNQKFKSNAHTQRGKVRENIRKVQFQNRRNSTGSKTLERQKRTKDRTSGMIKHNPQLIQIGALPGTNSKQLGLCTYQYQNTIAGRIQSKRSHHLSFQKNKIKRLVNENSIYYNRHEDLDFSHTRLMNQRKLMKTYHPFESYTERSVFQPREELDKFFDTDVARRTLSPKRAKEAVRQFDKVVGRSPEKPTESARLTYQTLPVVLKLKKKPISLPLQTTPRQLSFSPEIFSTRRGCNR